MEGNGRYLGVNNFCAECGVTSLLIGQMQGRLILANATLGKQSQWQQEPPFKEALEQIERSADTDCGPPDTPPYLHRNEAWQLGNFYRRT